MHSERINITYPQQSSAFELLRARLNSVGTLGTLLLVTYVARSSVCECDDDSRVFVCSERNAIGATKAAVNSEMSARDGIDFAALLAHFEKTQKAHRVSAQ